MNPDIIPTPLDAHFAAMMVKLNGAPNPDLELAARTVSAWRAEGHICLPLAALGGDDWAKKLGSSRVVGAPGEFKPLILDAGGRLYLQRYWQYERDLAAAIQARVGRAAACDTALLAAGLKRYFRSPERPNWQSCAAETALRKDFCVITGGPGTGKTRTVVAILALLHEQFTARGAVPRIALAAPTGKAAARMKESIQKAVESDAAFEALRGKLPADATTLHRLLGVIPDSPYFRHDATRPLAADAVIVDEASMVDLALMAKLFAAVPPHARIVLLGDKDQLASVEAGNVLGDICNTGGRAASPAPIAAHLVELRKNYRFRDDSGIHRLSLLVNAGDADGALGLIRTDGGLRDVLAAPTPAPPALAAALRSCVLDGYRAFLEAPTPLAALEQLGDFRILCATRRGPFGVENLNRLVEQTLASAGRIAPEGTHYHGRPVLIRTNDYQLHLFNGDVGLILRDPEAGNELRAFFVDAAGELRRLLPARLPEHETAFAMTVHKSQGSEFGRVLLVLPDRDGPLLTRELAYTGLTRARDAIELWANDAVLRAAIQRRTERSSGLREALWGA
ncbi:MAG: exodeoxyribonuclease alpha subunit [Chthoniobacter sp.]|jgi:exodeoxyribonuclease V alpha subunit|nr:exodeoxyribonuclease alpha subunit [Chthoniobacter sp.]